MSITSLQYALNNYQTKEAQFHYEQEYFDYDYDLIPSQSAFNQRRSLISPNTFPYLFDAFSSSFPTTTHQFKDDMCILAFDGCHVVYTTNAELIEDYNKPRLADYKGYNHMHLNGFVDVISQKPFVFL